jgi:hypothetical protein
MTLGTREPPVLQGSLRLGSCRRRCLGGLLGLLGLLLRLSRRSTRFSSSWLGFRGSPQSLRRNAISNCTVLYMSEPYQIVPQKLHDEGRVLVALLRECVELFDETSAGAFKRESTVRSHLQSHRQRPAWQGGMLGLASSESHSRKRRNSGRDRDELGG